jgi:hypothetical protein
VNPRHSSESAEWYTPSFLVESSRVVMGGIDMDPASSDKANRVVRASFYYTRLDNALERSWGAPGTVATTSWSILINAPGNCGWRDDPESPTKRRTIACGNVKACSCRLVPKFWEKLLSEYYAGRVAQATWIGFSLDQLTRLQDCTVGPLDFPTCIPKKRIPYTKATGEKATCPPHGSYITYLGPNREAFRDEFQQYGKVLL